MDALPRTTARRHGEYVTALELVAFAIHPGNTESTTTVCLHPGISTLFLTSQSNLKFVGVDANAVKLIIDGLIAALAHKDREKFWLDHCVLAETRDYRTQGAEKRDEEKIGKLYHGLFAKLFQTFLLEYEGKQATLTALKTRFGRVTVILTNDIFDYTVTTTGLHGESRIVRFLYINRLREWRPIFVADPVAELEATKATYGEVFHALVPELNLTMASSQPACGRCSGYCDTLGIHRGETGNDHPANWVHPITGNTTSGGFVSEKTDRFHAACYGLYD